MFLRTAKVLVLVTLVFLLPSCRRLTAPEAPAEGTLLRQSLAGSTSIPASFGNLISTDVSPANPNVLFLWFQNGAGSIRMVGYDIRSNVLINVTIIERQ